MLYILKGNIILLFQFKQKAERMMSHKQSIHTSHAKQICQLSYMYVIYCIHIILFLALKHQTYYKQWPQRTVMYMYMHKLSDFKHKNYQTKYNTYEIHAQSLCTALILTELYQAQYKKDSPVEPDQKSCQQPAGNSYRIQHAPVGIQNYCDPHYLCVSRMSRTRNYKITYSQSIIRHTLPHLSDHLIDSQTFISMVV